MLYALEQARGANSYGSHPPRPLHRVATRVDVEREAQFPAISGVHELGRQRRRLPVAERAGKIDFRKHTAGGNNVKRWAKADLELPQFTFSRTEFVEFWRQVQALAESDQTDLQLISGRVERKFHSIDEFKQYVTIDAVSRFTLHCGQGQRAISIRTDRWFNPRVVVISTDKGWAKSTAVAIREKVRPFARRTNAALGVAFMSYAVAWLVNAVVEDVQRGGQPRLQLPLLAVGWIFLLGALQSSLAEVLAGGRIVPDRGWSYFNLDYLFGCLRAVAICALAIALYMVGTE